MRRNLKNLNRKRRKILRSCRIVSEPEEKKRRRSAAWLMCWEFGLGPLLVQFFLLLVFLLFSYADCVFYTPVMAKAS
jgi:hypothetical protein